MPFKTVLNYWDVMLQEKWFMEVHPKWIATFLSFRIADDYFPVTIFLRQ